MKSSMRENGSEKEGEGDREVKSSTREKDSDSLLFGLVF